MYSQSPYVCRVEWGLRGAREAAERGDITVIVDVLSFSSTVVTAFHFAPWIFLHRRPGTDKRNGLRKNEKPPSSRTEKRPPNRAAEPGGPSLSPVSLNGAACSAAAAKASALLVGPCSTLRRLTTQPNESTPEPEPTSRWYRAVNNGRMPERVKTASVRESRMIWGPGRSCPG